MYNNDAPPVTDPVGELQALAGRLRSAEQFAGELVSDLGDRVRYSSPGQGTEQLRAEVAIWERLQGHLRQALVDMAKLNISDRLARVQEEYASLVVAAVRGMLSELHLSAEQQLLARELVPRHLRAVGAAIEGEVVEVEEVG